MMKKDRMKLFCFTLTAILTLLIVASCGENEFSKKAINYNVEYVDISFLKGNIPEDLILRTKISRISPQFSTDTLYVDLNYFDNDMVEIYINDKIRFASIATLNNIYGHIERVKIGNIMQGDDLGVVVNQSKMVEANVDTPYNSVTLGFYRDTLKIKFYNDFVSYF